MAKKASKKAAPKTKKAAAKKAEPNLSDCDNCNCVESACGCECCD